MAYANPAAWYLNFGNGSSTGYYAVPIWASGTPVAGQLCRQATTPTVGNERVFVCIISGVDAVEPTWTVTKGARNIGGSATWQECTGQPGVNGDISSANCPQWTVSSTPALGLIIYDPTSASLQICSTSGAGGTGSKPTFSATAGVTTADASATWTSLGLASAFTIWSAPFARLQSAWTTNWEVAGNTTFVSASHAETQAAALTMTSPGAAGTPNAVYCVLNAPATTPPGSADVTTGALITTTGNNSITLNGSYYWSGITQNCGTGAVTADITFAQTYQRLDNCALAKLGTTANLTAFQTTPNQTVVDLRDTTLQFGAVGDSFYIAASAFYWRNTASALAGAVFPTDLFKGNYNRTAILEGVDLSAMGSGKTLCAAIGTPGRITFIDCKFGASVTVAATPTIEGEIVNVVSSDSSGTTYNNQSYQYQGTLIPSTSIVRTGGAALPGPSTTTPIAWNISTTANAGWLRPFESPASWINNPTTGSPINVIIYGVWFGAALPNNDQVWHDVEYYGSASSPLASLGTGTKANGLASGSAWAADTSAWDSEATARLNSTVYAVGNIFSQSGSPGSLFIVTAIGSSPHQSASSPPAGYTSAADGASFADGNLTVQAGYRFKMSVSVTPQLAGYIHTYVKAALASSTFYIDPQVVL